MSNTTKPKRTAKPTGSAADFIPPRASLTALRAASKGCRGCDLFKLGTQTVFGEGPSRARLLVVGEQPGDAEDKAGRPFVGPSGLLLDRALEAAGIDRDDVYVTNAVKHFKWARDARTTRRIHKTPSAGEVRACRPWLEHEIALVRPEVIVALGATAAKALLGPKFSVMKARGVAQRSPLSEVLFATVHPSAVLRAPRDQRVRAERMFFADLGVVGRYLQKADSARKRTGRPKRTLTGWPATAHQSATSKQPTRSSRK